MLLFITLFKETSLDTIDELIEIFISSFYVLLLLQKLHARISF